VCLPQVIKSFQNYRGIATTFYRTLVFKLAEFLFCLPGINTATESTFSFMSRSWSSDKSQLGMFTLKAVLVIMVNYDETCAEFSEMILTEKHLLKEIHNSEKYCSCPFYF
jgi:hypothetical protein